MTQENNSHNFIIDKNNRKKIIKFYRFNNNLDSERQKNDVSGNLFYKSRSFNNLTNIDTIDEENNSTIFDYIKFRKNKICK